MCRVLPSFCNFENLSWRAWLWNVFGVCLYLKVWMTLLSIVSLHFSESDCWTCTSIYLDSCFCFMCLNVFYSFGILKFPLSPNSDILWYSVILFHILFTSFSFFLILFLLLLLKSRIFSTDYLQDQCIFFFLWNIPLIWAIKHLFEFLLAIFFS